MLSGFGRKKLTFPEWEQNYGRVISGVAVLLSNSFGVVSLLFPDHPNVKRQETVHLFLTHTCKVSTNDFEYYCILNGAVITISG